MTEIVQRRQIAATLLYVCITVVKNLGAIAQKAEVDKPAELVSLQSVIVF